MINSSKTSYNPLAYTSHALKYQIITKLLFQNTLNFINLILRNFLQACEVELIYLVTVFVQSIHCSVERYQKKKNVLDIVPTLKDNIMSKGRNDGPSNLLLHTNPLQTLVAENNNNFLTHHSVGQELKQG